MYPKKILILIASILFFLGVNGFAQKSDTYKVEKVKSGLGVLWGMTFLNGFEILYTQRNGFIGKLNISTKKISPINSPFDIMYDGQGGLLDVKKAPDFKTSNILYFTYVKELKGLGVTTLASARFLNNKLIQPKDILITKSASNTSRHFGSRITFDDKGHLFFTVGDRGVRPNAQDLSTHAGKILRLNLDGTVPLDNPFIKTKNALPEIYSYGHRNPQGIFYDKRAKNLYSIEHGPRGGDEINLILKGANYGWPIISYGKEYWSPSHVGEGTHKKGMKQPIKVYIPSIAPSSLLVYSGYRYPEFKGDIFAGALKLTHINRMRFNSKNKEVFEKRMFEYLRERIRHIIQGPDGLIYFSTDSGNIYRVIAQ